MFKRILTRISNFFTGRHDITKLTKLRLSKLIDVATDDVVRANYKKKYVVNFDEWGFRTDKGFCYGCFAGHCLLRSSPKSENTMKWWMEIDGHAHMVGHTLNEVRLNNLRGAITAWTGELPQGEKSWRVDEIALRGSGFGKLGGKLYFEQFVAQMRRVSAELKEIGY